MCICVVAHTRFAQNPALVLQQESVPCIAVPPLLSEDYQTAESQCATHSTYHAHLHQSEFPTHTSVLSELTPPPFSFPSHDQRSALSSCTHSTTRAKTPDVPFCASMFPAIVSWTLFTASIYPVAPVPSICDTNRCRRWLLDLHHYHLEHHLPKTTQLVAAYRSPLLPHLMP